MISVTDALTKEMQTHKKVSVFIECMLPTMEIHICNQ
jgi:hypothetical protein